MSSPPPPDGQPAAGRARQIAAAIAAAIVIAVPAEGFRRTSYLDVAKVWTACWGSTSDIIPGRTYSMDECRARLASDMQTAVETVERCAPGLPVMALAALSDAVFNLGGTVVCDTSQSTLARHLRAGRIDEACRELPKWSKARVAGVLVVLPGLVKRREAEMQLCLRWRETTS